MDRMETKTTWNEATSSVGIVNGNYGFTLPSEVAKSPSHPTLDYRGRICPFPLAS
jgi:hypothetical protein